MNDISKPIEKGNDCPDWDEPPIELYDDATGPLDQPVAVTFFTTATANQKAEEAISFRELATRIRTTSAATKPALPWLKLARFGDNRTEKGSYRHDANVLAISGIEADYDGGKMSVDRAVEALTQHGVAAMVYASPSHTAAAPRWRVLCPLSTELPPDQRQRHVGRLNGLLGGILAGESFTLSQSYYFGSVANNPDHRVELIEGIPIDQHDDLDEIWIGRPGTKEQPHTAPGTAPKSGPVDEAALIREITTGKSYHTAMIRLAGHWASVGVDFAEVGNRLRSMMEEIPTDQRDDRYRARAADIERTLLYVFSKRIEDQSSADVPWPDPDLSLIRQEAIAAPPIPANVFPPVWSRWIAEAAEGAGAPQAFITCALLSAVGTLIGNARWAAPWHPWKEPPAINVALIGRPSSGKSPALDQVIELLTALEIDANDDIADRRREGKRQQAERAEKMRIWDAEVKNAVKAGMAPPSPPENCEPVKTPQRRRIYSTDPTIEKAGRLSEANPRGMMLQRDELAGWIAAMDRYGGGAGGDRPFWLQAYGGRAWTPDRVKDGDDPVHVPHLLWSILGTIQPDRVSTLMMSGDDDGLSARFIYCWPEALPPRRPSCEADTEAALDRLRRIRALPWQRDPEPHLLPFTGPAAVALHDWRIEVATMEAAASGLMLSWLGKLPGLAVRIALVLELLAWSETPNDTPEPEAIGDRTVIAAITFLSDFAIPMARRTFGAAALPEAERDARRLARWLIQQRPLPNTINARALRQRGDGPGIPDAERMETALKELDAAGWVRAAPARAAGHGRPRKDWATNPKLEGVEA